MRFAVLDKLKESVEAIDFSSIEEIKRTAVQRASARKVVQRREFATLMRSIKSMVREKA